MHTWLIDISGTFSMIVSLVRILLLPNPASHPASWFHIDENCRDIHLHMFQTIRVFRRQHNSSGIIVSWFDDYWYLNRIGKTGTCHDARDSNQLQNGIMIGLSTRRRWFRPARSLNAAWITEILRDSQATSGKLWLNFNNLILLTSRFKVKLFSNFRTPRANWYYRQLYSSVYSHQDSCMLLSAHSLPVPSVLGCWPHDDSRPRSCSKVQQNTRCNLKLWGIKSKT